MPPVQKKPAPPSPWPAEKAAKKPKLVAYGDGKGGTVMLPFGATQAQIKAEVAKTSKNPVKKQVPWPAPGKKTPMKVGPAKPPTLATQIKGLVAQGKGQPVTVPYNQRDFEIASYMAVIKAELKKKYKNTWSQKYKSALNTITSNATKVPDALVYLQKVLIMLNPNTSAFSKDGKVSPGEFTGLIPPDLPLSPAAKKFIPTGDAKAKAAALAEKIAAYEAEIKRLIDARSKAEADKAKAVSAKEKLGGIDEKLLKYFNYVEKHCSEFLKVSRNTRRLLYRGQEDSTLPIFVGYPRADRIPKDSDREASELLDKSLKLMGFKALRSNSIFTSGSQDHAEGYGDLYAIFPKNGFEFTWSTEHNDLVINSVSELTGDYDDENDEAEELYYDLDDHVPSDSWLDGSYQDELLDLICDAYNLDYDKKAHDLVKTVTSSPEFKALKKSISKWGDVDYYQDSAEEISKVFLAYSSAISAFSDKFPKIAKQADLITNEFKKEVAKLKKAAAKPKVSAKNKELETAKKIIKNYGFTHENLAAALKSEHEICILGEYVAISYEMYEREIDLFFKSPKVKKGGEF